MSLMNMVTKVAIGFALAKGVSAVQNAGGVGALLGGGEGEEGGTEGGLGGMLGNLAGGEGAEGGLGGMLGNLTGGEGGEGGLGDMLGNLTGGGEGEEGGGLGGLLGNLGSGAAAAGGLAGVGGLLGGLAAARGGEGGGLADLLNQDAPAEEPDEDVTAGLMIRAMIMAARADGEIDPTEQETLMSTIGKDASPDEMEFVRNAMSAPVDPSGLASETPQGMETQLYSMSVMAIEPDNQAEAKYLHELASSLGINEGTVNEIHDSFGVQRLYA